MDKLIQSLTTLGVYLIVLIPSVWLTNKAQNHIDKKKKKSFLIFSAFSILLPCLLAAFRGENVGNDVAVYAERVFFLSGRVSSLSELFLLNTRFEPGYMFLGFISSIVFQSFNMMLFLTQLLIDVPIYVCAYKIRDKIPMWSTMLCFYFLFYISSFNIMRESIGAAFILLAFIEMLEKHNKRAVLFAVIAFLFHRTAIIGFALILFIIIINSIKTKTTRFAVIIGVVIAIMVLLTHAKAILAFMSDLGIIPQRYVTTYSVLIEGGSTYLSQLFLTNYIELIVKWGGLIIPLLFYRKRNNLREEQFKYSLFVGVLMAVLINTGVFVFMHSSYGYRISLYLEYLFIFWLPSMLNIKRKIEIKRIPETTLVFFLSSFAAFFVLYIWRGSHGTFPFYFQIYS